MNVQLQVLITEDDVTTATMIKRYLEEEGHSVMAVCKSGEDAIRFTAMSEPDVLLMDIYLEGEIDGICAAKLITERLKVPVIFLTSHDDSDTRERAQEVNPYRYIVKPVSREDVNRAVMDGFFHYQWTLQKNSTA
jgi:CheY-like chemotaxis protein